MANVHALITMSVDGYITGPDDVPGQGLGKGGERLHAWVFGGKWSYGDSPRKGPVAEDAVWFKETQARFGAIVGGRYTYDAARHWGDRNPFGAPMFIVTHRPEEQPDTGEFTFVDGVPEAIEQAREVAKGKDVNIMGGGDVIRQALAAGLVDELTIIVAPLILGAGKRLFEGFEHDIELQQLGARQSQFATFLSYRVG
jgi:dihydrofolate reductase